jgi:DUF4097 and DUF4098 domain-containing protein YvlB
MAVTTERRLERVRWAALLRLTTMIAIVAAAATRLPAQDYHFSKVLSAGATLEVSNINGKVDVTRASGQTAEVTVTKTVKRGDGNLVKAIMDDSRDGMHVCTIYLTRDPERRSCNGDNDNNDRSNGRNRLDVDMRYTVRVPLNAKLVVDDVNGSVTVTGAGTDSKIETVNGDIIFDGIGAISLETVNGKVDATFARAAWEGTMRVSSVNGAIDLTFPASLSAEVHGETVNGGIDSGGFPIPIEKGFGPKSFDGRIGSGGRRLELETVNGGISLHKQ